MSVIVKDPWFRNRLIRDAIYRAIYERMKRNPLVYVMGEGSHMKIHYDAPEIERDFPDRVITLPISEDANTNFAVGLAIAGVIPIVDVISSDFLYRTMDAICNTAAKGPHVGHARAIVIRSEFLTGGPTSGQRIEAMFTHVPGLNVVLPSNPADACGLMQTAMSTKSPTIFFEDRMIPDRDTLESNKLSDSCDPIPFGRARIRTVKGSKVTVVSYGLSAFQVEKVLAEEPGLDCDFIDLRTLVPLDMEAIVSSVQRTGALLVVEPAMKEFGVGSEVLACLMERGLMPRTIRLGGPRATIPASRELHDRLFASMDDVRRAIKELS